MCKKEFCMLTLCCTKRATVKATTTRHAFLLQRATERFAEGCSSIKVEPSQWNGSSLRALESLCRHNQKPKQSQQQTGSGVSCVRARVTLSEKKGGQEHCRFRLLYSVEKCLAPYEKAFGQLPFGQRSHRILKEAGWSATQPGPTVWGKAAVQLFRAERLTPALASIVRTEMKSHPRGSTFPQPNAGKRLLGAVAFRCFLPPCCLYSQRDGLAAGRHVQREQLAARQRW